MATRRPNMPRVRPAGNGDAQQPARGAGDPDRDTGRETSRATGPAAVNRNKVVPLGAAPGHDADAPTARTGTPAPAATPAAAKARRPASAKTPASAKAPAARPVSAASQAAAAKAAKSTTTSAPADRAPRAGAGKPASGTGAPGQKPAPRTPAARRPGKRPGGPREKRLRERAELSGAIRSGDGPGPRQPSAPQGPADDAAPVPARAFSGRMLALAVILAVVTVLLLPSVGTYMNQRAEIAELQQSIAQKQQEQDDLKTQIARWDDPAYVKAQARNRINLVMPGEKKYMVIGATGDDTAVGPQSTGNVRTDLPWVDSLWDTVVRSATD